VKGRVETEQKQSDERKLVERLVAICQDHAHRIASLEAIVQLQQERLTTFGKALRGQQTTIVALTKLPAPDALSGRKTPRRVVEIRKA
jgi:transcriptional regulator of NAD metabolism